MGCFMVARPAKSPDGFEALRHSIYFLHAAWYMDLVTPGISAVPFAG